MGRPGSASEFPYGSHFPAIEGSRTACVYPALRAPARQLRPAGSPAARIEELATSKGRLIRRSTLSAVSLWLNAGVPATEVARRAGHGVAVLLKIYAHCIDGQATAANQRIAEALGTQDAEQDPGDEGDGDIEQAS